MLLLIDNCEHLLDDIAVISETLLRGAPHLHILATSREALRAEGEHVQRLDALACPPVIEAQERAQALSYPALQLLIERAMSSHDSFELSDAELPLAIDICHRLDGIPLAIELAAAQIGRFGLSGLLAQLQGNVALLTRETGDGLPRQQTLWATLDWSYALLTADEQSCLRRLAVLRGSFTLESATAVILGEHFATGAVLGSISQLVAKSLLNVEVGEDQVLYRLLDTTRAYALEKLAAAGELFATRERHVARCLAVMTQAGQDWQQIPSQQWLDRYAPNRDDIRAALDWGLGQQGSATLAIRLTACAMPLWQELSLLREHGLYVSQALALLAQSAAPCPHLTMTLKLALGSYSYHTQGGTPATIAAFVSARTLAENCADLAGQLRAVSGHMAVNLYCGNYRQALAQSLDFERLGADSESDLALSALRLRVLAQHFAGDQLLARQHAEHVLQRMAQSGHLNRFTHGFGVQYDQSVAALTILARILWLQGFPEKAQRTARQALELALQIRHGTSICYTLALSGCVIAHYNGDTDSVRTLLDLLLQHAEKNSLLLFHTWARHYAQVLNAAPGVTGDEPACQGLIQDIVITLRPECVDAAALQRATSGAAGWCSPEILRAHAQALLNPTAAPTDGAEALLLQALALAGRQGALAWELRSATSLAQLWQRQGQAQRALAVLEPVYARFTEGFATPDLLKARDLLDALRH